MNVMQKSKLLEGFKVIDLTIVVSGATVTSLLADMGAEVIKIEHPRRGDDARYHTPVKNGTSGSFQTLNRGKKGLAVDVSTKEGSDVIKELAKTADAIVQNFKPGTMKKWGLDYETLSKINPGIVMASISAFGQTGPLSNLPGYDIIAQAMSGLMNVNGHPDKPPTRIGVLIGDIGTGAFGCIGLLAALLNKERTGLGQHVDISMQDVLMTFYDQTTYTWNGTKIGRTGNRMYHIAPYDTYPTKDGRWLIIAIANEKLWVQLCEIMGKSELANDYRFNTNTNRCDYYDELNDEICQWTKQHPLNELVEVLQGKGVPAAPILDIDEVLALPHVQERKMCVEVDDPLAGKVKIVGSPIKFSRTPAVVEKSAPMLGENTHEILLGLGYSEEKIRTLAENKVIKMV
jgi:CoA:oxalate CoA-transferase